MFYRVKTIKVLIPNIWQRERNVSVELSLLKGKMYYKQREQQEKTLHNEDITTRLCSVASCLTQDRPWFVQRGLFPAGLLTA